MRSKLTLVLLITLISLYLNRTLVKAQNALPAHKEWVSDNPNADADIKLFLTYLDAWSKNDSVQVRRLVAPTYMGYGPSSSDSISLEQTIKDMQGKPRPIQVKYDLLNSFTIKQGSRKGTWVEAWGTQYTTLAGKSVSFPFHYVSQVANGKILQDIVYFDMKDIDRQKGIK